MFVRLKMINRKVDPGTGSGWIIGGPQAKWKILRGPVAIEPKLCPRFAEQRV